jgi:cell wall-associated NlpC family hydrolase
MKVTNTQQTQSASNINYITRQFLNVPYLWGGKTPFGIDCSGFSQIVVRCIGINLHRDAYQQAEQGKVVSFLEEVQTGDLAFFDNEEGRITHVGIMLNSHSIIHASGKVRLDNIDSYGILDAENRNYSHKLRIIKRLLS